MSIIKHLSLTFILLFLFCFSFSQDTIRMSRQDFEAVFLKENLLLIAEKLNISKSEAILLQVRQWPNPVLSVDEVNLWTSERGTNNLSYFGEELPPIKGNFGKNSQISFSLEQLILTAGKRRKLMALEQVSVDKSMQYYEELLRALKLELRSMLYEVHYMQIMEKVYEDKLNSVQKLLTALKRQLEAGNISDAEYIRLKAYKLEIANNRNEIYNSINDLQKELKLLMRMPVNSYIVVEPVEQNLPKEFIKSLVFQDLLEDARKNRADLKIASLNRDYYSRLISYEKAQRVPNIVTKGGYDRGGNFMYNFVGFGLEIDLPVFDRNRGNLRYAGIGLQQSEMLYEQMLLSLDNELAAAYNSLLRSVSFFESIEDDYSERLERILAGYHENFLSGNVSLLEYLDFMNAYIDNRQIVLEAYMDVQKNAEELNFVVGRDVVKIDEN